MYALIDKNKNEILTHGQTPRLDFGGEWGDKLKSGEAEWQALPVDCIITDVKVDAGSLVVDVKVKEDRLKEEKDKKDRKDLLKNFKLKNATLSEVIDFLESLRIELGLE
jgi:hypothetical protein